MSPNRGRHIVRQAPPKRLERPSLDRPSLFAGMEAGDSIVPEDDDAPRGGILSTLESVRQRKPMPGRAMAGANAGAGLWQNRVLWGVMGAGVVALLGSFVLIVSEGHSKKHESAIERAVLAQPADVADAAAPPRRKMPAPQAPWPHPGAPGRKHPQAQPGTHQAEQPGHQPPDPHPACPS